MASLVPAWLTQGVMVPTLEGSGGNGAFGVSIAYADSYGRRLQVLVGCWGVISEEETAGS